MCAKQEMLRIDKMCRIYIEVLSSNISGGQENSIYSKKHLQNYTTLLMKTKPQPDPAEYSGSMYQMVYLLKPDLCFSFFRSLL